MSRKAIICGGSIGGLFAAAALRREGWSVDVYERTGVELSGRGAGIVTHPQLVAALQSVGADTARLGVAVDARVAFDRSGADVARIGFHQVVTSWDHVHQALRVLLPDGSHHLGRTVAGYSQTKDSAEVRFADGGRARADLVIGADGFRSVIRGQMLPDVQPEYSGYLVWRALAREADLSADAARRIFGAFGFYLPTGLQVIGYPIPGPQNDLRPGHRRYNFVWYLPVDRATLDDMLTDADGQRHEMTIPPPLVRADVQDRMMHMAQALLPSAFVDMLRHGEQPFFTPIYDHLSPVFADGRVALLGDAACVARPHVGMGVTKAAEDALALTRLLQSAPVHQALAAYSAERLPAARAALMRSRMLGSYIFTAPAKGDNADGRDNPNLDEIMRLTAVAL